MKKSTIVPLCAVLLASCTGPLPPAESNSKLPSSLKEFSLVVRDQSTISRSTPEQIKSLAFPAKCLKTSTDANGNVTAIIKLNPAYGGHGDAATMDDPTGATQRLTPKTTAGGNVISVTSKMIAGIPLESLHYLAVDIEGKGTERGIVSGLYFHVSGENIVSSKKITSGKFLTTFKDGGATFSIALDRLIGFENGEGGSMHENPSFWSAEVGTLVYLNASGWTAERVPAGPDSGDYSFLETQSERGEFD